MPKQLTAKQAKKLEQEYRQLYQQAQVQLAEQKKTMRDRLQSAEGLNDARRNRLTQEVSEIALDRVTVQTHTTTGKPFVQVVYSFPDDLHDYLKSEECDEFLRDFLANGIELDDFTKPIAEDTAPKTGKSVAKIRAHLQKRDSQ